METVLGVIAKWDEKLLAEIGELDKYAINVSRWDHQLRGNQAILEAVTDEVQKLMFHQQQVGDVCSAIEEYQMGLSHQLMNLSKSLDEELELTDDGRNSSAHLGTDQPDLYSISNDLFTLIEQVQKNLQGCVKDLDSTDSL
jgi:hypothetical protein